MPISLLWIPFTLLAAAGQTARNAMQRELTATLGTVGATHVRFLFGFPFALVFLAGVLMATGLPLPRPPAVFWPWVVLGAGAQIVATATDARDHERPLVRGHHRLHQDRGDPGGAVRPDLPWRSADARHGRRHPGRDRRRRRDVAQGQGRHGGRLSARRCSACSPARCSRSRRSAIAARSCRSGCRASCWRRPSR